MNTGTHFIHSVPVPRLYKCAAKFAKQSKEDGASIKNLVYERKHTNIQGVYALAVETLKRRSQLDFLIKKSQILEKEPRLNEWLARILITELIWGKKHLPSGCKPVQTILAYEQILKAHLTDAETHDDYTKVKKPRFVRVNSLKLLLNDAVEFFQEEGWMLVPFTDRGDYGRFLERVVGINDEEFMVDIHVDNLLIFPPSAQFYNHPGYLDGQLMLQDKASCLPTQLLNPTEGSIILDMCAAPGMKTTHLAAHINNNGTIFSIEKNVNRCEVLRKMVETAGATCVKVLNKDAITLTAKDIPDVEYILVDPSCSGSGMVDRLELELQPNSTQLEERLKTLAGFQIKLLKHSLRSFPKAKRVVYSTCSIYPQENEDVVSEVIAACTGFKLLPVKNMLKEPWFNFASNEEGSVGSHCLYAKPEDDLTNGFFVAVFERLSEGEENVFLKPGLKKMLKEGRENRCDENIQTNSNNETTEPKKIWRYERNYNETSEPKMIWRFERNYKIEGENNDTANKVNDTEDVSQNTEVEKKNKNADDEEKKINNSGESQSNERKKKKCKKDKREKNVNDGNKQNDVEAGDENTEVKKKRKNKNANNEEEKIHNTSDVIETNEPKKKKCKKDKREKVASDENKLNVVEANAEEQSVKKKKKKKKHESESEGIKFVDANTEASNNIEFKINEEQSVKKIKKKKKHESMSETLEPEGIKFVDASTEASNNNEFKSSEDQSVKKIKKKKKHEIQEHEEIIPDVSNNENTTEENVHKKKKKNKKTNVESADAEITCENGTSDHKKKKKKHNLSCETSEADNAPKKRKKNKHNDL